MPRSITLERARRLALAAQGFSGSRPARVDVRHFRRVLAHIGLVQLDSVNVIARAHYLPFFSRLGDYSMEALDAWLWRSREAFEYWGHEASVMPIDDWSLMGYRMREARPWRSIREMGEEHPEFVEDVLAEVAAHGPITVSDLSHGTERTGPWWGWGKGKLALEWLFVSGSVTVADRPNFTKLYDLTERVIDPVVLDRDPVEADEAKRRLLRQAVRHHGIGTAHDLADYYRLKVGDARPLLGRLAESGEIEEVTVPGWKGPVYLDPALSVPRSINARALLAPFDPVVWFRDRALRLFDFHYRIEIYVPKPKRVFGYYVLPFLLGDRIVARVDLKADRAGSRLCVRSAHGEKGIDPTVVARELAAELTDMAMWLGLDEIEVETSGDLAGRLAGSLS